jgi:hypothetical protein
MVKSKYPGNENIVGSIEENKNSRLVLNIDVCFSLICFP